jgi:N-acetyl-1-D-myo-inositol-2-amino-2-deoxy-alpha-D-glucopyranoside deacetylase
MERMSWPVQLVLAMLGGGLVGLLGTVVEQGVLYIGTFPLPWGLVLALALVLSFLIGLRLVVESRWVAISGLVGILIVTLLLMVETPGGSVLIPANLWGTIWSAAPGILGAIVVAWPRLKRSNARSAN